MNSTKTTSFDDNHTPYESLLFFGDEQLIANNVEIEKYRNISEASDISEYLRIKATTSWSESQVIIGLRATDQPNVFYGYWDSIVTQKKSLVVVIDDEDRNEVSIEVYKDLSPEDKEALQDILSRH